MELMIVPTAGAILPPFDPMSEYPVPEDDAFVDPNDELANELLDFVVADDLREIGERLIQYEGYSKYFWGMDRARIQYLWGRKKSLSRAACARPSGALKYLTGGLDYVVTFYALNLRHRANWRDAGHRNDDVP